MVSHFSIFMHTISHIELRFFFPIWQAANSIKNTYSITGMQLFIHYTHQAPVNNPLHSDSAFIVTLFLRKSISLDLKLNTTLGLITNFLGNLNKFSRTRNANVKGRVTQSINSDDKSVCLTQIVDTK